MPAYGYEFYLLVVNSISHSFAALTREISSWPLEDKIHIHARACNILYLFFKVSGMPSGNKLIKTIRYLHMWRYDILTCEDIDDFTYIKFVS